MYPTKGNDNWIAISVFTESQWRELSRVIGDKALTGSETFSTYEDRKSNEDELDKRVARWTANYDNRELMDILQSKGIPAGVVLNAEGTHNDPQLTFRKHFWKLKHSVIGHHTYDAPGFRFSKMPAPCVGEHNDYAYSQILGFSDEEFATLMGEGIID